MSFMLNVDLVGIFGLRLTTLMALIAADVVMGVALALNRGEFKWRKTVQFYRTMVGPYLLGYVAFAILVKYAALDFLGEYEVIAEEATIWAVWLLIVKTIGIDSFLENAKELYEGLEI